MRRCEVTSEGLQPTTQSPRTQRDGGRIRFRPHVPGAEVGVREIESPQWPSPSFCAFAHRPPDEADDEQDGCGEGAGEEQERAVQNRLTLHPHFDRQRPSVEPISQVLFPRQDVAARDVARLVGLEVAGVVVDDLAGQVQAERDQLAAAPADVL